MRHRDIFGHLPDGRPVERLSLDAHGMQVRIITWGATVQDLRVGPQRVILGADDLATYLGGLRYAGAMVGRFANRIGQARFALDGTEHHTDPNFQDRHTLHGGATGTGARLWSLEDIGPDHATLGILLPDGDGGFPGELTARVTYAILPGPALSVTTEATTTRATPCSFAHHGYFVLDDTGDITGHLLQVDAAGYLPVDDGLIPTGQVAPVEGTPFDFRDGRRIGADRYDHNLCLSPQRVACRPVARLTSPVSGLEMIVETTESGLQIYDGRHLGGVAGHGNRRLRANAGLAMEAQCWPDAPNRPDFPDAILRPGATYRSVTRYRFAPEAENAA